MGAQADLVREDIIDRILSRALLPGDKIDEEDLRSRLSLSGTPIREAFISLESAGLIERKPRGGALLARLDFERLMKLIEVLAEAEGSVAYYAARRINPSQAKVLEETSRACTAFAEGDRPPGKRYFDLNLDFHRALIAASGNEFLEEYVYHVGNRLIAYLEARHRLPGEYERSAHDHRLICEAVLSSNGDKARSLMMQHVTFSDTSGLDVMNALRA